MCRPIAQSWSSDSSVGLLLLNLHLNPTKTFVAAVFAEPVDSFQIDPSSEASLLRVLYPGDMFISENRMWDFSFSSKGQGLSFSVTKM